MGIDEQLPYQVLTKAAQMFGGATGMSLREMSGFFQHESPMHIPFEPYDETCREDIFKSWLKWFTVDRQRRLLLQLCHEELPMHHGQPIMRDRAELAALLAGGLSETELVSEMKRADRRAHDPWGPISATLYEVGSSDLVENVIRHTGVSVVWPTLDDRSGYSHKTRIRAYKPAVEAAYSQLHGDEKRAFVQAVTKRLLESRLPDSAKSQMIDSLAQIGWSLTEAGTLTEVRAVVSAPDEVQQRGPDTQTKETQVQANSEPTASHHPKAFISHSSQDHNFVLKFSTDLRAKGVDAWYAEWEIKPGDSIRAKIDEGLEGCEFFIIVLSKNSIIRPWVLTELDGATIRKLNGSVRKIIPVKIEDCGDLPPTLASLLWEDFSNKPYGAALNRVLASIFDVDIRPPLGPASQPGGNVPKVKKAETAPKHMAEDASNRSTLVLFFLGVAASLLPAGLQLIGITVNLLVGSAMILTALVLAALAFWWASGTSKWRVFLRCLIVVVMLGSLYLTFLQVLKQDGSGQAPSQAAGSPQAINSADSPNSTDSSRSQQVSVKRSSAPISGTGTAKGQRSLDPTKADQMPSANPNSESKLDNTVQRPTLEPPAPASGNPVTSPPAEKPKAQAPTPEQKAAPPTVPIPRAGRQRGTVKWFNAAKGYGSITTEEGADVFVHFSAITEPGYRTLDENAKVEFTLVRGPKGSQAENVRLVK